MFIGEDKNKPVVYGGVIFAFFFQCKTGCVRSHINNSNSIVPWSNLLSRAKVPFYIFTGL